MIINEELLYYVWMHKAFDQSNLQTYKGESVQIIKYGNRNLASGPDFANASIIIDGVEWHGSVEMHVLTNDWIKHNHNVDLAYNNVILHVVYDHDGSEKIDLPTLILKDRIPKSILENFTNLMDSTLWVPCEKNLHQINLDQFSIWINKLVIERLENKTESLNRYESYLNQDWNQLLHVMIAKYFGAKNNMENFEVLAHILPHNLILKNLHQSRVIEALVFGVSGFLNETTDDYQQSLTFEYQFLKSKYQLTEINFHEWKKSGMYPAGNPTYRLAQFATFLQNSDRLFDQACSAKSINELKKIFEIEILDYWKEHYKFGKKSEKVKSHSLSEDFIDRLIINAVIPVVFAYAQSKGDYDKIDDCINLLNDLPSEHNAIIDKWKSLKINSKSAADSQALIQLKSKYCDAKRCLNCQIGHRLIYGE